MKRASYAAHSASLSWSRGSGWRGWIVIYALHLSSSVVRAYRCFVPSKEWTQAQQIGPSKSAGFEQLAPAAHEPGADLVDCRGLNPRHGRFVSLSSSSR